MSRSERILLWSVAVLALALRAVAYFRYRFDSDEQQHLHVTWGWTAGRLPYRDVFDNHAPLFHFLTAPFLAPLGERPDVLLWMRAPMLLLFAVVVWGTWVIGRRLYDDRVGLWAAAILAVFPPFFLKSLEFRTDNLWNALWVAALLLLTRRTITPLTGFGAGIALGAALATSLKTPLLLIALAGAAAITWLFALRRERPAARFPLAAFLGGLALVPAITVAAMASAGILDEFYDCAVVFNARLSSTRGHLRMGRALFLPGLALVLWPAWRYRRTEHLARYFFAVACGVYCVVLGGFWLLISPRDLLPVMPLAAVFAAAAATTMERPLRWLAAIAMISLASLWYYADRFENRTAWHSTMLDQALRLTRPGEPLIDLKGETIFRDRPFFYAFEVVTREQMAHGLIPDTLAADVIRTRTYVAQADGPMWPPQARAFLSANFLNMGRLRAAGQWIAADGSFTIAIPGPYLVLDEHGEVRGTLDGTPYNSSRHLEAGTHHFSPPPARPQSLAVLWAPAFRRRHSPFHLRDLEF